MTKLAKAYLLYLAVFSAVAFFWYALDKRRAIRGERRISESMLLGFSFLGGGVGGYLAMHLVRHKTRKVKFHIVNLIGIAWQMTLLILILLGVIA